MRNPQFYVSGKRSVPITEGCCLSLFHFFLNIKLYSIGVSWEYFVHCVRSVNLQVNHWRNYSIMAPIFLVEACTDHMSVAKSLPGLIFNSQNESFRSWPCKPYKCWKCPNTDIPTTRKNIRHTDRLPETICKMFSSQAAIDAFICSLWYI